MNYTSFLFVFLFALSLISQTSAVLPSDIGLKLVLTQPGLGELLLVLDEDLTAIAEQYEPLYIPALPPYSDDSVELLLTEIFINHTSHDSLVPIILPGQGLEAKVSGLVLTLSFNMDYNITQGRRTYTGQDHMEIYINETTMVLIANITAESNGNPLVVITPNITLEIGHLVIVDYGTLEPFVPVLETAFLAIFQDTLPVALTQVINQLLYNFTSSLELKKIALTPGIFLDLSLPNNPYTTESLTLVVDLRGFAYFLPEGRCLLAMKQHIPAKASFSSRMLQFAISDQVLNCLAASLFDSKQLNVLVNGLFQMLIDGISEGPMQAGLGLKLNTTLSPTVTSSSTKGITFDIPSQMTWSRSPPISSVAEEYVALSTNLSLSLVPSVENDFLKINITGLHLNLGTAYAAPTMPQKYLDQMDETNWPMINTLFNSLIVHLVDFLNEQIKDGFHIPEFPSDVLTVGLGTIQVYDGYIVVATSFVGKDK